MLVVNSCIILNVLGTTSDIHVGIVRHGIVVKELFLPVYIRITLAHQEACLWIVATCRRIIIIDKIGSIDATPA